MKRDVMGSHQGKKAVGYLRSGPRDSVIANTELRGQEEAVVRYAEGEGMELCAIFRDAASANSPGRKGLQDLLAHLKKDPSVTVVITKGFDRLFRSFADYIHVTNALDGIEIHLTDTHEVIAKGVNSHEALIHGIRAVLAADYYNDLSKRVAQGMAVKAAQGCWPSAPPFGYVINRETKMLEPDPSTAPLIRQAFELAASGTCTLADIREATWAAGLKTPRTGAKLSTRGWLSILRNSIYYGPFSWGGEVYQGKHEPIISRDLFERAQAKLPAPRPAPRHRGGPASVLRRSLRA